MLKKNKFLIYFIGITVVIITLLYIGTIKPTNIKKNEINTYKVINKVSLDYVTEKILEYNIQHPDIVLGQCILESNLHTKQVIRNNNLFGMKSAWVRTTVALNPKKYEYAKYSSIDSSILDYKLWQLQYANNLTRQQYLLKLEQIYATDTLYIKKLLNIIKNESKYRAYQYN